MATTSTSAAAVAAAAANDPTTIKADVVDAEDVLPYLLESALPVPLKVSLINRLGSTSEDNVADVVVPTLLALLRAPDHVLLPILPDLPLDSLVSTFKSVAHDHLAFSLELADAIRSRILLRAPDLFLDRRRSEWLLSAHLRILNNDAAAGYFKNDQDLFESHVVAPLRPLSRCSRDVSTGLLSLARLYYGHEYEQKLESSLDPFSDASSAEYEARFLNVQMPADLIRVADKTLSVSLRVQILRKGFPAICDGNEPSKPRKMKEIAAGVGAFVRANATALMEDDLAPAFVEELSKLVGQELLRMKNFGEPVTEGSCQWLVDFVTAVHSRTMRGETSFFFTFQGPLLGHLAMSLLNPSQPGILTKVMELMFECSLRKIPGEAKTQIRSILSVCNVVIKPDQFGAVLTDYEAGEKSLEYELSKSFMTDPGAYQAHLERMIRCNTTFVQQLSSWTGSSAKLLLPHAHIFFDRLNDPNIIWSMFSPMILSNIAAADPRGILEDGFLWKVLVAMETSPFWGQVTHSYWSTAYVQMLSAVVQGGDDDGRREAVRRLIAKVEQIYSEDKLSDFGKLLLPSALLAFLSVAKSHLKSMLDPIKPLLQSIADDSSGRFPDGNKMQAQGIMNEMSGLTLESLKKNMSSMMSVVGIDPGDPLFDAVKQAQSMPVDAFDCMLSYNWSHQSTVIKIRDSLQKRGLSVWMDLDQMTGDVYAKMATAVLGSDVIICCLTAAYEASGNCKRELGFAADQTRVGKKIVPVRLEDGPFTWSALITAGLLYTPIGQRELDNSRKWEAAMDGLFKEVCAQLPNGKPREKAKEGGADAQANGATLEAPDAAAQKPAQEKERSKLVKFSELDPADPGYEAALTAVALDDFDVMLSYNWAHQRTVLEIRDTLIARGLNVWMDVDEMAGNVYNKMAEAVLSSSIIVACLTQPYSKSGNCIREFNFAADNSRPPNGTRRVVPIALEEGPCVEMARDMEVLRFRTLEDLEAAAAAAAGAASSAPASGSGGDVRAAWNAQVDQLEKRIRDALAERRADLVRRWKEGKDVTVEVETTAAAAPAAASGPPPPATPPVPAPAPTAAPSSAVAVVDAGAFAALERRLASLEGAVARLERQQLDAAAGSGSTTAAAGDQAAAMAAAAAATAEASALLAQGQAAMSSNVAALHGAVDALSGRVDSLEEEVERRREESTRSVEEDDGAESEAEVRNADGKNGGLGPEAGAAGQAELQARVSMLEATVRSQAQLIQGLAKFMGISFERSAA